MVEGQHGFTALYYPYATIDDYEALKKAAILYDKIYIIDPDEMSRRAGETPKGARYEEIQKFKWETKVLREHGVLDLCNPQEEVDYKDRDLIAESISNDLTDRSFLQMVNRAGMQDFYLAFGKIANLIRELKQNKELGTMLDTLPRHIPSYEFLKVPGPVGASIMTNYAAYLSQKRWAATFTDDKTFHRLLLRKFRHLKVGSTYEALAEALRASKLLATEIAIQKVFDGRIPDFELRSFEDVLELREKLRDELTEIRRLFRDADIMPWDNNSALRLQAVAQEKISELTKKVRTSRNRLIRKLFVGTFFGLAAKLFLGAPLWASLLTGAGSAATSEAIDLWRLMGQRSRLTFLLRPYLVSSNASQRLDSQ